MDQRPTWKSQNYQTLRRKIVVNLCDFGFGNVFLDMTPKHKQQKEKIDKMGFQLLNFCASEDSIKKVKRQSTEMGVNICK